MKFHNIGINVLFTFQIIIHYNVYMKLTIFSSIFMEQFCLQQCSCMACTNMYLIIKRILATHSVIFYNRL